MKKRLLMLISILALSAIMTACSQGASGEDNGKIKVTTTTAQIADVTRNVAGDAVEVKSLMGPGIDPHLYQASQGDIQKLNQADIIFYNGLHLEGKMGEIFEKMSNEKPTVPVASAIPENKLISDKQNAKIHDPHVWFDISLWIHTVDIVEEELSKLSPENKDEFAKNAAAYKKKLQEMNQYAKEQVGTIPEESRVLVTAHDAFTYFGNAYGFEVMGLQGLSTDSEYGLRDVQNLVDVLAVFVESSISEKSINAVVEGSKKRGHEVVIGGQLYSDAMGEEGTEEGTYLGMFKHNIDTIVSSLK
jgi:manganese/zinc/iron transport system substrate-binding protein